MIRYYITDRIQLGGTGPLLDAIARNIAAGVDWIQIREKDLPTRELVCLVRSVIALRGSARTKILVNTRADIAIASGADGVHLPAGSPILDYAIPTFLTGVSCHTIAELQEAQAAGASFTVYGPVFTPRSKSHYRSAGGIDGLREACAEVRLPVLALGGITEENISLCMDAGAAGIAAITLFQRPGQ